MERFSSHPKWFPPRLQTLLPVPPPWVQSGSPMEPRSWSWGTSWAKWSYGANLSDLVGKGQALGEETRRLIRWREAQPVTGLGRRPRSHITQNHTGGRLPENARFTRTLGVAGPGSHSPKVPSPSKPQAPG